MSTKRFLWMWPHYWSVAALETHPGHCCRHSIPPKEANTLPELVLQGKATRIEFDLPFRITGVVQGHWGYFVISAITIIVTPNFIIVLFNNSSSKLILLTWCHYYKIINLTSNFVQLRVKPKNSYKNGMCEKFTNYPKGPKLL